MHNIYSSTNIYIGRTTISVLYIKRLLRYKKMQCYVLRLCANRDIKTEQDGNVTL